MLMRYAVKRLASAVVVLVLMIVAMFILQSLSPADPARALAGDLASKEALENAREQLGLDRPLPVRIGEYLIGLLHFDMQMSLRTRNPVAQDIARTLPASVELLVAAAVLALVGGLIIGFLTITSGRFALLVRSSILASSAIPVFLSGLLFILIFYGELGWLPGTGRISVDDAPTGPTRLLVVDSILHANWASLGDAIAHLVAPAIVLAAAPSVAIGRAFGSALTTAMRADYVRTARMKGLSTPMVVLRHALRNCMNSALSMTGLQFGVMLGAIAIVEQIFAWPGIGAYLAISIQSTDITAIIGVAVVLGAVFIFINSVIDIVQTIADPRIALGTTR